MASIRRTLSPAKHDRTSHPNGSAALSPLSVGSPAHQFLSDSKPSGSTSFSAVFFGIRRSLLSLFCQKQTTRRGFGHQQSWRRSILRCMICFLVGLLLGLLPFGRIDDMKIRDFTFERKSETSIHVEELKQEIKSQQQTEIVMSKEEDEVATVALSEYEIKERFDFHPRDLLIVVTPTYNRALQGYYLNRLGQALRLVNPPILWIVVEMNAQSTETADILRKMGIMYRHLVCTKNMTDIKDRGVQQRNTALEHIERHRLDGIVYFADDDNIYSLELFERIRKISRFGTWPVAMLAQGKNKAILEGPVCNNTQVIGWHTNEKSARLRRFHVDMSGFAFNSTILWDPRRWNRPFLEPVRQLDTVREGFQETTFIEQLVAEESQMEGLPDGCGNIMNWHIHIEAHNAVYPSGWLLRNNLDVVLPLDRDNEDTTTA